MAPEPDCRSASPDSSSKAQPIQLILQKIGDHVGAKCTFTYVGAGAGQVDEHYFRPTEVDLLLGDPAKARAKLGWRHRVSFRDLVTEMVTEDLKAAERA